MKQIILLSIYLIFLSYKNEEVLANESTGISFKTRVIGGEVSSIQKFPHILSLRHRGIFVCAASSVGERDILTSAHCFTRNKILVPPYLDVTVHSGTDSLREIGTIHEIEKVTIHPGWVDNSKSGIHDIAHIKLKENSKIEFDEYRSKLDLPKKDVVSGSQGIMLGWGCTFPNIEVPSQRLHKLEMRILDYKRCQPFAGMTLSPELLCAYNGPGRGCSHGDSGSPLVSGNEITGIFSWFQKGKCGTGAVDMFTNVFAELGFIEPLMRPPSSPDEFDEGDGSKRKGKGLTVEEESPQKKNKLWCGK